MRKTVNIIMGLDEKISQKMFDENIKEKDFVAEFPEMNP